MFYSTEDLSMVFTKMLVPRFPEQLFRDAAHELNLNPEHRLTFSVSKKATDFHFAPNPFLGRTVSWMYFLLAKLFGA